MGGRWTGVSAGWECRVPNLFLKRSARHDYHRTSVEAVEFGVGGGIGDIKILVYKGTDGSQLVDNEQGALRDEHVLLLITC